MIENLNNVNCSARNPSKLPYLYDIKRQSNFRQGYPCRKHTENTSRKYEYSISIELGYPSERIPTDELILGECIRRSCSCGQVFGRKLVEKQGQKLAVCLVLNRSAS